ncbi:MAG: hypothetical protein O6948_06445, partial [Deltaproteobacteria bacterium]|nr:hypothetical protein [Deltaproteobacteria bacterium]
MNSLFGFGHRDPKKSGGDRVPASIGTPKQLAGRADSPRKPISAQKVFDKGRYVNLRGGFQTDLSAGRGRDGHLKIVKHCTRTKAIVTVAAGVVAFGQELGVRAEGGRRPLPVV